MPTDKVTSIGATAPPRTETPHKLDQLLGYAGTIQGTPLDDALDEQREALWLAQSMVDTVAAALIRVFGDDGDWKEMYPDFPRLLDQTSLVIANAATNLEAGYLEDRALAIARVAESQS